MPPQPFQTEGSIWKRFLLGCLAVVVLMTAATASSVILELKHVQSFFTRDTLPRGVLPYISPAAAGAPETILVIGSDKRAKSKSVQDRLSPPHSDTLMLIRMDPNRNQTSVLSIPRDLKVAINGATQKINAAYSIGRAALAVKVIKQTMPGIEINHVVDINFAGFRHVIDAIGCVYVFVDHRYLHQSLATAADNYASINIKPGYQKLCDQTALSYARYRHTDSDFVRVARQQDFVRAAKSQVSALGLFSKQDQLLGALKPPVVETDIHGSDVPHLIELSLFSLGRPIRQVHFDSTPGPSYVTATAAQVQHTLFSFLYGNPPAPKVSAPRRARRGAHAAGGLGLIATSASNMGVMTNIAVGNPLPVYIPHLQLGATTVTARAYTLFDESNHRHHAYVISVPRGLAGEYYGFEGTDWTSPPILDHPSETRKVGGRSYLIFAEGGNVHVIAWRTPHGVYWVNNTLLDSLSGAQMLALAQSAHPLGGR